MRKREGEVEDEGISLFLGYDGKLIHLVLL